MCLVDVAGARAPVAACTAAITHEMVIETETEDIRKMRRINLELLYYEHRGACTTCDENGNCPMQQYAYEYGLDDSSFVTSCEKKENYTTGNLGLEYDPNK